MNSPIRTAPQRLLPLFLALCGLPVVALGQLAPPGVTGALGSNGHCYYYVSTAYPWASAQAYAQSWGQHLVRIDDAAENDFVRNVFGDSTLWIGLTDTTVEGEFRWTDGTLLTGFLYNNWRLGEPNNSGNEDAVVMLSSGAWNDTIATLTFPSVIETPAPTAVLSLVEMNATSIVLTASFNANGFPMDLRIEYGPGSYVSGKAFPRISGPDEVTHSNVVFDGLIPGTTYYFRGAGTNMIGHFYSLPLGVPTLSYLQAWRRQHFQTISNTGNAADNEDPEHDGVRNFAEYAYGLNPNVSDAHLLPQLTRQGDEYVLQFTQPPNTGPITYGARSSTTLQPGSWSDVTDTGTSPQHRFAISATVPANFIHLTATVP